MDKIALSPETAAKMAEYAAKLKIQKEQKKAGNARRPMVYYEATTAMRARYGAQLDNSISQFAKTHSEFVLLEQKFKGERVYLELYEDMLANKELWFSIFSLDSNCTLAECCVGILGNLATILR